MTVTRTLIRKRWLDTVTWSFVSCNGRHGGRWYNHDRHTNFARFYVWTQTVTRRSDPQAVEVFSSARIDRG